MKAIVVYWHGEPWKLYKNFAEAVEYVEKRTEGGFTAIEEKLEWSEYESDKVCIQGAETYGPSSHYFTYEDWMDRPDIKGSSQELFVTNIID